MSMATIRRWHFYLGMLIAPSVLFFALTGLVQVFGLHQSHDGYAAPALIQKLSSVHKDQVFALGHHGPPPTAAVAARHEAPPGANGRSMLPVYLLKWFFALIALGLAASTGLGMWIGLTRPAGRRAAWVLLLTGVALPVALLLI